MHYKISINYWGKEVTNPNSNRRLLSESEILLNNKKNSISNSRVTGNRNTLIHTTIPLYVVIYSGISRCAVVHREMKRSDVQN